MSEISGGDAAAYAAAKQTWTKPVLNVEPLGSIIASGVVKTAPTYPLTSIAMKFTANWTTKGKAGLLFRIINAVGANGETVCWGILRKDNIVDVLYPDVKSDGDFGYATNEGITIVVGDAVFIYDVHPNWALISRVTPAGLQKKQWDKAYTTEGTTPPPVCIMGHDKQADVDTGTALAAFSFVASSSYDWISGASIASYLYTLPTGAVVTGGAVNTHSVTFTIAAGIYVVQCKITSTSGISRSGFRTIYANDTGSDKSFGENYAIEAIASDVTSIDGWEGQFTVLGDVSGVVYPGCKCHWYVPVYYDGARLTDDDAFIDVFVGYLTAINVQADSNQIMRSTLTFTSPLKLAKQLPSATQQIEEVNPSTTWTEVINGLSHPAYAAYYVLQYHTTMVDNHDFIYESAISNLRRRVFGFPADNINAHLILAGQIMRGDVGCRSDGTITVTQEPSLQNATDRDARDEKFTWTEASVRDRLTIAPTFRPKIAYLIIAAVAYDGNPAKPMIAYASKAPGYAQAQGVTKTNMPDISITKAGGASELYGVAGHMFALLNNPLSKLSIPIAKMFDIADPADPDWHILNIDEDTYLSINMDDFGIRWSSTTLRMRPVRVTRQWSRANGSWVKNIIQTNRVESSGQPGVFHPTYKGEVQPYINPLSGWLDGLNVTMPDINIDFNTVLGGLPTSDDWNIGWAFNDFGDSGYSENWNGSLPSYASASVGLGDDELVVGQAFDGSADGSGYLITRAPGTTEEFLYSLYENPDISADPTNWSLDHSWEPADWPDVFPNRLSPVNVVSNASQTMHVSVEKHDVYYQHKPAAGAWQARATIGSGAMVSYGDIKVTPPIALDGVEAWSNGRGTLGGLAYVLYKQPSVGGVWAEVANYPINGGAGNGNMIEMIIRGGTNTFVTVPVTVAVFGPFALYRVDDATSTWTDITPDGGDYAPRRYNALAVNGANVWCVATNVDGENKIFSSTDNGDNWTERGRTRYNWVKHLSSDDVFVLGGDSILDVSNNELGTFHSRLGQWGSIGSVGIVQDFNSIGFF